MGDLYHISLFVQAKNVTYFVVHDVCELSKLASYSLDSHFSSSCIGKSQPKICSPAQPFFIRKL